MITNFNHFRPILENNTEPNECLHCGSKNLSFEENVEIIEDIVGDAWICQDCKAINALDSRKGEWYYVAVFPVDDYVPRKDSNNKNWNPSKWGDIRTGISNKYHNDTPERIPQKSTSNRN